jgi:hypothetical protein
MIPDLETGLVTLPKVVAGPLVEKFGKFSLCKQVTDFEIGSNSNSNSNSTSPWIIACEPAPEPSCEMTPLHEHFPYSLYNSSRAHVEALAAHRASKEIASEYSSDSNPASGYYSDPSYEFDFGSDPIEPESELNMTAESLLGPATSLVITSTPIGRFVCWPDRKHADLTDENSRYVAYLDTLPLQEGTPLAPNVKQTPTEVATTDSSLYTPAVKSSWRPATSGLRRIDPTGTLMTS